MMYVYLQTKASVPVMLDVMEALVAALQYVGRLSDRPCRLTVAGSSGNILSLWVTILVFVSRLKYFHCSAAYDDFYHDGLLTVRWHSLHLMLTDLILSWFLAPCVLMRLFSPHIDMSMHEEYPSIVNVEFAELISYDLVLKDHQVMRSLKQKI